jgi:hypothetical protein
MWKPGCTRERVLLVPKMNAFRIPDGGQMNFSIRTELVLCIVCVLWALAFVCDDEVCINKEQQPRGVSHCVGCVNSRNRNCNAAW